MNANNKVIFGFVWLIILGSYMFDKLSNNMVIRAWDWFIWTIMLASSILCFVDAGKSKFRKK